MEHSSINSLNSKRNLKLPPIQGAVPATVYGERNWNTTNATVSHHRQRTRPKNDLVHASNFQSLNRVDLNSRVEFPPPKAAVFTSPSRQHHLQINLGHDFPKSYTVLPPINHHRKTTVNRTRKPAVKQVDHSKVELSIERKKSPVTNEETKQKPPTKSRARPIDQSTSNREIAQEKRITSENNNSIDENLKATDDTTTADNSNSNDNSKNKNNCDDDSRTVQEDQVDITARKSSPTFSKYVKCARFRRRNAVCIENEETLTNVTDQLKEIFLRRNMEEMYLI